MALAQATKDMAHRHLLGLACDLESKVRDTFPFAMEPILLGAYPEFVPVVQEMRSFSEPVRELWPSWSGSLPVAVLLTKSWPQIKMVVGGGPVRVESKVVRPEDGVEPLRYSGAPYTFGTVLRLKVTKLRDDPWLPQMRFSGYGLPTISSNDLRDHVRVSLAHPLYGSIVEWAETAMPRFRQAERARAAISFLHDHANSAGHFERLVPDLVPLLPERIQRGIGEAKRASPLPRSIKKLPEEQQRLGIQLCAELATTLSIAMLNPRDDKLDDTCRLMAFDSDLIMRAVNFQRTR